MYYINENVVTFYKESFVEGFIYHGSPNGDIKVFEPRESTQKGAYVYATDKIEIAGVFGFKMSSIEKSLSFCGDKTLIVTERVQGYFKIMTIQSIFINWMEGVLTILMKTVGVNTKFALLRKLCLWK